MKDEVSRSELRGWIESLRGRRVVVVGDPVLDVYLYGTTHRISREAPVLIVREDAREGRLGGAANTAANLAALGARTAMVGVVGDDEAGEQLVALAETHGIDTAGIVAAPAACTITKTRVMAGGLHTRKQQMLRIDREATGVPDPDTEARLRGAFTASLEGADALVIADYTPDPVHAYPALAAEARRAGKIVVVDSRFAVTSFPGVTAVTPNEPEVEAALGLTLGSADAAVKAAERVLADLGLEAAVITRGREGMAVARRAGGPVLIAAHGSKEAVDVTGAGDTVTATFTLALAAGAPVLEAAVLANCAASISVQAVGAATVSPEQLAEAVSALDVAGIRVAR